LKKGEKMATITMINEKKWTENLKMVKNYGLKFGK